MKKNHFYFKLLVFALVLAVFFPSCKKNKDTEDPVISLMTPIDNAQYQFGDTIYISGIITDNVNIEWVKISLLNSLSSSVMDPVYLYPGSRSYDLSLHYPLDDLTLPFDVYTLQVTASDGENERRAFVSLNIMAAEKTFERLLAICASNALKTYVYAIDESGASESIMNIDHAYVDSDISSLNRQLYYVKPEPSIMYAYNLDFLTEDYQYQAGQPYPVINDVHNNVWDMVYVASENGDILSLNPNGSIAMVTQANSDTIPKLVVRQGLYVVAYCEERGGPERYLRKYHYSTGALLESVDIDVDAVSLFYSDGNWTFIFGNDDMGGCVFPYHVPDNELSPRYGVPEGNLICVEQVDVFRYLVATEQVVYEYNYDYYNNSISQWSLIQNVSSIACDRTSGIVYLSQGNVITIANLDDGEVLNNISLPYEVMKLHIQYNW